MMGQIKAIPSDYCIVKLTYGDDIETTIVYSPGRSPLDEEIKRLTVPEVLKVLRENIERLK
jgi:hypothetical protein